MEGGFDGGAEPEVEWEELHEVVVLPSKSAVSLPNSQLPAKVWPILIFSTCVVLVKYIL